MTVMDNPGLGLTAIITEEITLYVINSDSHEHNAIIVNHHYNPKSIC